MATRFNKCNTFSFPHVYAQNFEQLGTIIQHIQKTGGNTQIAKPKSKQTSLSPV